MGLFKDFKDFAMRGNVIDMAVGVVIGGAFAKITSSLVTNILMPPIGVLLGGVDFSNLFINLGNIPVHTLAETQEYNVPVIAYGVFINTIIDFLIIALKVLYAELALHNVIEPRPSSDNKEFCVKLYEHVKALTGISSFIQIK